MSNNELETTRAQLDRMRAQLHSYRVALVWMANEKHCRHNKDGGVCLACYARMLLLPTKEE